MNSFTNHIDSVRSCTLKVPVSRRRLAMHYFPSPTVSSSVRRMSRWLADDVNLLHDLEAAGYYPRKRWFTKKEVDVFIKYFGE